MKASEVHNSADPDVVELIGNKRQELFNLRFQHATGQLEDTAGMQRAKRDLARAGVVGDPEPGLLLDHRARSRISTRRQRFVRLSGRLSMMRTVSPMCASLRSSCAWRVAEVRTIFL